MMTLDTSKPIETSLQTVKKKWCDYNGHMNVAYYSLAFENANFEAQEMMGMGEAYIEKDRRGLFSMKNVFTYQQEVGEGDPLRIVYRVMDYSPKLLHILLEMYHAEKGYLSCFTEQLLTCKKFFLLSKKFFKNYDFISNRTICRVRVKFM